MDRTDKKEFWAILGRLRASYPQRVPPDEWKVTLRRYYEDLGRFPPETLIPACDRAMLAHPDWFPTLPQILDCCRREPIARSKRLAEGEPWADNEATAKVQAIMADLAKNFTMEGESNGSNAEKDPCERRVEQPGDTAPHEGSESSGSSTGGEGEDRGGDAEENGGE